jgi:4-methylaminobutanoate oxidase (formaldehyde-forming)
MTRQAQILILGAGILGSALAWRLAARGLCPGADILVVDPNPPAAQASSRAAALLSLSRPAAKAHWIPLGCKTQEAFATLAAQGLDVPFHRCGALHLADGPAARAVLADHAATAQAHGVRCEARAPADCAARVPWLDMARFTEALWFPDEGYTDPYLLASAYAAAARALGVRFRCNTPAALVGEGATVCVDLPEGRIRPATVWVAAGAWSSRVLQPLGLSAPQAAVRSQYWITENTALAPAAMPMVLAADLRLYARPEVGAILFGLRENAGVAVPSAGLPDDLAGFQFDPADPEGHGTLEAFAHQIERYAPGLMATGLRHYITGPSCYTPDGDFLVGALPGWANLKLLAGCNGAGIAASAGLAELAADCAAGLESAALARLNPARFGKVDADAPEWRARCIAARAGKTSG